MPELDPVHLLEAALLTSSEPLSMPEMKRLFEDALSQKTIRGHLETLARFWSGRGLRLEERADGRWGFRTAESAAPAILQLREEKPARYSRAAMETLAVIAYRQPVTRADIEAIRGVAVNPSIIRQFEERGWIETVGWRETPGRPALLGTTSTFLADLGLKSLEDLPEVALDEAEDFALGETNPGAADRIVRPQTQETLHLEEEPLEPPRRG